MKTLFITLAALFYAFTVPSPASDPVQNRATVIIVVGAGGEEEYASGFAKWAGHWQKAAAAGDAVVQTIGLEAAPADSLKRLRQILEAELKTGGAELWLVLLGHGNPEAGEAKFNLAGDDLSATELAALLKPFERPLVLVNAFSASGGFLTALSGPGRTIVSATKGASERNYARFGEYLAEGINDPAADRDKDGQTSLLEAWLSAAHRVAAFYSGEGRLATEHSLLEDTGDGKGTPADFFHGVRVVKKAKDGTAADGLRAHQLHLVRNSAERALSAMARAERDVLEVELAKLRDSKASMPEADYYSALEAILLTLAKIYQAAPVPPPAP